jgi:hypothetical protein
MIIWNLSGVGGAVPSVIIMAGPRTVAVCNVYTSKDLHTPRSNKGRTMSSASQPSVPYFGDEGNAPSVEHPALWVYLYLLPTVPPLLSVSLSRCILECFLVAHPFVFPFLYRRSSSAVPAFTPSIADIFTKKLMIVQGVTSFH